MSINILINGAFGRMGQMTVKAITDDPRFTLVGQTSRDYNLAKAIHDSNAQVVIDFTTAEAVYNNTLTIIEAHAHPVIGTSGLTSEQIQSLQQRALNEQLGGIIAPNFSLGAILMMKAAKEIAKYMPNVEIIELHHAGKVDSPSGTAMRTAELIMEEISEINPLSQPSRETIPGSRGANYHHIPIHAVRLPGLLAHQMIIFGTIGETLTLKHDSLDRQCFMPGVLLACEKVMHLKKLIYGLESIL